MTYDEAWTAIKRHFRKNRIMILGVVCCLVLILSGVGITIINYKVGIPIMLFGAVVMTVTLRIAGHYAVDVDGIYEKYILSEWLGEIFTDVRFDSTKAFKRKELSELPIWDFEWEDSFATRCFTAAYGGLFVRAADVSLTAKKEAGKHISRYDLDEPEYVFWGRLWEIKGCDTDKVRDAQYDGISIKVIDDRVYMYANLYKETGAYPIWMQAPDNDDCDAKSLKDEVLNSLSGYVKYLSSVAS